MEICFLTVPDPLFSRPVSRDSGETALAKKILSFPTMCLFLLAAVIFSYAPRGIAESDIWWHLRNAKKIVVNRSIPNMDMYSWGAAGSPWLDHEWLSEIIYYFGFQVFGLHGILTVYFAVLVFIYLGVYYRCCHAGADRKDAIIATLGAICLGGVSFAPRMLLFGWLCMTALLVILDRFEKNQKTVWLLPPLFCLWINLHGSWIFGMVVLAATVVSGLFVGEWGLVVTRRWTSSQLRTLLLVVAASAAAIFLNPFGYRLVWYPFDMGLRQQSVLKYLDEWQPVDFSSWNGKLALALIFCVITAALFSRRKWRLDAVLLTSFALWSALAHVRFLFFAGLVVVPLLAPYINLLGPFDPEKDKPLLNAVMICLIVAGMTVFFPSEASLRRTVSATYPNAALNFMQQHGMTDKVFNEYKFGGYMEWYAPQIKPFIDGRADIFVYNGAFDDFIRATSLRNTFETLDKYSVRYVLYEPGQPFTYLLEHSPSWHLVYSDNVAVIFECEPAAPRSVVGQ